MERKWSENKTSITGRKLLNALIFQGSDLRVSIFCRFIYTYQMMLKRFVEHRTDSISAGKLQPNEMINYLSRNELHMERNARRTHYP